MRHLQATVEDLLPLDIRFQVQESARRLRYRAGRCRLWQWRLERLAPREGSRFEVLYLGRPAERWRAWTLAGRPGGVASGPPAELLRSPRTALVSEAPLPGALVVPWTLHAVVPLGRPLEDVLAAYDPELRRRLRRQAGRCRAARVESPAEVDRLDREMLAPYAMARHGDGASPLPLAAVRRIALEVGRLDVVREGAEEIACHLGYELVRRGRRYWVTRLFGYPSSVYSDARRLRDANSVNTFLALSWAAENGFDFYDMGSCDARPDDGLLQWKRRRGGAVDTLRNEGWFRVRLPLEERAGFLWESPLFATHRERLALHLGIPEGPGDDEVVTRYREMGFGGLETVHLHCARRPGDALLERMRRLYARQARPPTLVPLAST